MQGRIKVLKDVDKSNILPMTHAKAVYVDEKNTLDKTLDDIKKGTVKVIDATESELIQLVDNKQLIPGAYYRYTDWQIIYKWNENQPSYNGVIEPLLLKAISHVEFHKVATSELHPNDIIHFDFEQNKTPPTTLGFYKRGAITRRYDTKNRIGLPGDWRYCPVVGYTVDRRLYITGNNSTYEMEELKIGITPVKTRLYISEDGKNVYQCIYDHKVEKTSDISNNFHVVSRYYDRLCRATRTNIKIALEHDKVELSSISLRLKDDPELIPVFDSLDKCRDINIDGVSNNTSNDIFKGTCIGINSFSKNNVYINAVNIQVGYSSTFNIFASRYTIIGADNDWNYIEGSNCTLNQDNNSNIVTESASFTHLDINNDENFIGAGRNYFGNENKKNYILNLHTNRFETTNQSNSFLCLGYGNTFKRCNKLMFENDPKANGISQSYSNNFEACTSITVGVTCRIIASSLIGCRNNQMSTIRYEGSTVYSPTEIEASTLRDYVNSVFKGGQLYNCDMSVVGNVTLETIRISHTTTNYLYNKTIKSNSELFNKVGDKRICTNVDNTNAYLLYWSLGTETKYTLP